MWYCAHAIFYFKTEGNSSILAHENVYLIESPDGDAALSAAEELARSHEDLSEDGHLEVDGARAQYIFLGIRKLISVETNPDTAKGIIKSGIEVTYSVFQLSSLDKADLLVKGEEIDVIYIE